MKSGMDLLIDGAQQLGIHLGEVEQEKFRLYEGLIEDWSKKINLVSYKSDEELYRSHFLDSLMCSKGYNFSQDARIIDLGSGAGFPGVPLAICFPNLKFCWLILGIRDVTFCAGLIESWTWSHVVLFGKGLKILPIKRSTEVFSTVRSPGLLPL